MIRETPKHQHIESEYVSFEDLFFSPTTEIPGRTYIEMIDNKAGGIKDWFVLRRLDLKTVLGQNSIVRIIGQPSPAAIAEEINRSRNMLFGPDDISFSTNPIITTEEEFSYNLTAMTGSYAYYGSCTLIVQIISGAEDTRLLEDGSLRLIEDGETRQLEQ